MAEIILSGKSIAIALAGGILPALFWLWFWLKQDRKAPEPRGLIALSFFAGMISVLFVLPLEKFVVTALPFIMSTLETLPSLFFVLPSDETIQIILWAFIEEFSKYIAVLLIAFQSRHFDEPIDAVIYLISAALGFAALENTLYLLKGLQEASVWSAVLDGNLRFIGASILHVVCSAFVGIAIAFSFYCGRFVKILATLLGIAVATLLHAYFNLSIIEAKDTISALAVFSRFWVAMVGIIVLLGVIRLIKPKIALL